jgi:uncharacterized NAD(P)/FAD-binding protein YdhS
MYQVAIIGGGFSGCAVAAHLLRAGVRGEEIVIFDPAAEFGRGVAYAPHSEHQLLNSPAGMMGIFSNDLEAFARFAASACDQFPPRTTYGSYIRDVFKSCLERGVVVVRDRVEKLELAVCSQESKPEGQDQIYKLKTAKQREVSARFVVLACGVELQNSAVSGQDLRCRDGEYIANPWSDGAVRGASSLNKVLLIGTGLTAVDLALELNRRGFCGEITALSRRGAWPIVHDFVVIKSC